MCWSCALVLLAGWRVRGARCAAPAILGSGLVSGLANAPGMGGLPVAAFFAAQTMPAAVFRATLVAYFPLLDLFSAPLYFWQRMVSLGHALGQPAGHCRWCFWATGWAGGIS